MSADLLKTAQEHLYPNYRQPPFVITRGAGCELFDADGRRYLDLFAGIAVSALGHAHPRLVAAIAEQAGKLLHLSNYFYNQPNVELAGELCRLSGMDRAFFCNSGTEAMEAMLKLARRHFFSQGQADRYQLIAFKNSFHGRTLGALAATGQAKYRDGFGPLPGVTHVDYGDAGAVRAAMHANVAAILFEPIQGEGGVLPAPAGFIRELRNIADEHGALLLADEIQTGVYRTGTFLACQAADVQPDAVAMAKALGGGVPIGSMLCKHKLSEALPPGSHGSTFGGSPLAAAAALAVLAECREQDLGGAARRVGAHLAKGLEGIRQRYPALVVHARGAGLLQALLLADGVDARGVLERIRERGVLITLAGGQALRFSPPLIVSEQQIDEGLAAVDAALATL